MKSDPWQELDESAATLDRPLMKKVGFSPP
jgi:hypothetical protein